MQSRQLGMGASVMGRLANDPKETLSAPQSGEHYT